MKKIIAFVLSLTMIMGCSSAFAKTVLSEHIDGVDELQNYDQIVVLAPSTHPYSTFSTVSLESRAEENVQTARESVLDLQLSDQGWAHIEEACLAQLDDIAQDPHIMLNSYTVLIPKTRAATPSFYATYHNRDYYTDLTSVSNMTMTKNQDFGKYSNLKSWSTNAANLAFCFSSVTKLNIAWTLVTAALPSKYTVHTSDWLDAHITINPTNRAIYVKEGTKYVNVANREYGPTRPYFIYHYNDATATSPTDTIYTNYQTYPDATSQADKETLLYNARAVYESGAKAVSFRMQNIVDLLWK